MMFDWGVYLSLYIIIEDVFTHIIQETIFNWDMTLLQSLLHRTRVAMPNGPDLR